MRQHSRLIVMAAIVFFLTGCGAKPTAVIKPVITTASPNPSATVSTTKVHITKDGFSPATIQVHRGETVTWTNDDTVTHTVSTDPYPTNTGLAGFDSKDPIPVGKTYTFTFAKTGDFAYHDQLRPVTFTGRVIVVSN